MPRDGGGDLKRASSSVGVGQATPCDFAILEYVSPGASANLTSVPVESNSTTFSTVSSSPPFIFASPQWTRAAGGAQRARSVRREGPSGRRSCPPVKLKACPEWIPAEARIPTIPSRQCINPGAENMRTVIQIRPPPFVDQTSSPAKYSFVPQVGPHLLVQSWPFGELPKRRRS